ncbi:putative bifunctional diguanylate cyclase/phosphodiesterase [Paucibacter sp. Y2R2-4]|uniref:putative bifunctional diguanylate cyclase/phosphodiesterase n=1 Tax=Paucibacter sp. Y2R2-4 TaxID=2893553 RepID=UPI0021E3A16B|nr:EAL domain-containing protein [Paucibacter sp. Y2R2-4]MCV2348222.1 EAL domain-containing protein [Paucibacter sp. Y2R2-4]
MEPPIEATPQPFRLTRYFSWVSLALIALSALALGYFAHSLTLKVLSHMAERRNEAMTAVFTNVLGQDFAPIMAPGLQLSADQLRELAQSHGLHAKTAALMQGSEIVKVKLYNPQGLTLYSSDAKQIGERKDGNPGIQSALAGQAQSVLTHRDKFDAFEGQRADIDLLGSYLPFKRNGEIIGVIELYQDVSGFVKRRDALLRSLVLTGLATLLLLYALQLLLVRRAQGIIHGQELALQKANEDLDQRVHERTEELALAKARLEHLAHHDPLTGLPNRLLYIDHLRRQINRAERNEEQLAVLYIDLDRFKEVNDTLGHPVGDELLMEVGRRLSAIVRGSDILARLGGDEFACVLSCSDAAIEAPLVAQKLIEALLTPMNLRANELQISASIGISLFPGDGRSADELSQAADTAMYEAKRAGRNRYHFYQPEMTTSAQDRAAMEKLLRRSLQAGELELHFQMKMGQPAADLFAEQASCPGVGTTLRPCGAEALARWHSPELGQVPPSRFIALAEESGFINELGAWVLNKACKQLKAWRDAGLQVPHVSVNLSVRQLERNDIVQVVSQALADAQLPADCLELEITESVIMHAENAIQALLALNKLGVRLSVDDFGTGYSSLAYLKLLPIQTLKIDRSFVTGIGAHLGDEAIIQAVIGMARSLGLRTVAEGVETPEQLAFLLRQGCDQIQGFLFSRPRAAAEFAAEYAALCLAPVLLQDEAGGSSLAAAANSA